LRKLGSRRRDRIPKDTFDVIILIGRPASGKSEIIDFLLHTRPEVRRTKFHIAELGRFGAGGRIVVVRGDSAVARSPGEERGIQMYANVVADLLDRAGVPSGRVVPGPPQVAAQRPGGVCRHHLCWEAEDGVASR